MRIGAIRPAADVLREMPLHGSGQKPRPTAADICCSRATPASAVLSCLRRRFRMLPDASAIRTLDQLHAFVHEVLCRKENLLADMFTTRVWALRRGAETCGRQFHLQGPRCVKLGAVWAADQNVVYFYDARGRRYRKERLSHRLAPEPVPA